MKHRTRALMTVVIAIAAITFSGGTAGAAIRNGDGQMSGPGGFRPATCDGGAVTVIGSGTFAAEQFGIGLYQFDVCLTASPTGGLTYAGTALFTMRSGAELRGTIAGTLESSLPQWVVTVTSGTRRFKHATGTLKLGPLTQTNETNCAHLICSDWTDSGPLVGTLRHVVVPYPTR